MATQQTKDFIILGPSMNSGKRVLDAIYSLYFLPENCKLVLAGSEDTGQPFYNEAVALARRDDLHGRVRFEEEVSSPDVVIAPDSDTLADDSVSGDTPEALASAILRIYRARQ
ncbi:MAG TPA: hypothetical protein VIS56_01980 [Candidatus Saccharimonadales bacterium]